MEYEFHEYCLLFPQADQKTIDDISADIKVNGQNEPIILYQGKILDGRNRYLACRMVGVEPSFKEFTGDEPLQYVISKNLHRRHLNESQRAMLAQKVYDMLKNDLDADVTQDDMKAQFNVSPKSIRTAAKVNDLVIDEIKDKVTAGTISLNKAAEAIEVAKKKAKIHKEKGEKLSDAEKNKIKKIQKSFVTDDGDVDIPQQIKLPKNIDAEEFNEQVLSGVYDGKRYRKDVQDIQNIIARLESIPSLFDDAMAMVGTLEQEKMLLAALDMLSTTIKNTEGKLLLHPISYDEVLAIVTDLLNERFKLPEVEPTDEQTFVTELKQKYIDDCDAVKQKITELRKKLKGRQ